MEKSTDIDNLKKVVRDFPEISDLLHINCQDCNDDYVVIEFYFGQKSVYIAGKYNNGFFIKDSEGKEHEVSIQSEKKCSLKGERALCIHCSCSHLIRSFWPEKDNSISLIEENKRKDLWKDINLKPSYNYCERVMTRGASAGLKCGKHVRNGGKYCSYCEKSFLKKA